MLKPLTQKQVISVFGDFIPYLTQTGKPSDAWEKDKLTTIVLPEKLPLAWNHNQFAIHVHCHKLIAPYLTNAFNQIYKFPEVWKTIDDIGGCYEFRLQRNSTSTISRHSWGIAIDLDVADNPFGQEIPKVDPKIIEIFELYGFAWGGYFPPKRRDGMHFEFANLELLNPA